VTFGDIRDNAAVVSTAKILAVRRLLAERRLSMLFQPIWRLDRGVILGYEALARPDEDYGLDGPREAFDIAERIGRAPELDALCREAILAHAGELPAEALLFVNLSPQSLDHPLLGGETLVEAVTAAGLTPSRIVLEITERSLARPAVVSRETKRLRDLGFRIALDDVGMGNTGLEMLRLVRADYLKIDRAVLVGALVDTTARSVLAAILAFAREAGTFVIAEGVETEEMLDFVNETGRSKPDRHAHAVQGYLTGRPSPSMAGTPLRIMLPSRRSVS
jgi:EAL domain-containing protein (putative c-di-GMP-specific phosphodiesterase class I)